MSKALNIIKNVCTWVLVAIAVLMMIFTIVSVNFFDDPNKDIFGYRAFIVLSDSMKKTDFDAGDLVVSKEVNVTTLKDGDIITFLSQNDDGSKGSYITHKIRKVTTNEQGLLAFQTYGTTTNTDDEVLVTAPFVVGKYSFSLPNVGTFFEFLKRPAGYIVCILIPFVLLIVSQLINALRILKRYKAEQMEELNAKQEAERAALAAEREKLEADRRRSEEMMAKLLEMQAAMQNGNAQPTPPADKPTDGE